MTHQLSQKTLAIVCDWDGTLVDGEKMVTAAYNAMLERMGDARAGYWTDADTRDQNGRNPDDIWNDTSLWFNEGAAYRRTFYQEYESLQEKHPELLTVKEGAKELLNMLRETYPQARLILLAAKGEDRLIREAQVKGFEDQFDFILGSRDGASDNKPKIEAFDRAVQGLTIKDRVAEVFHIGDNPKVDTTFPQQWGASYTVIDKSDPMALVKLRAELSRVNLGAHETPTQESMAHTHD